MNVTADSTTVLSVYFLAMKRMIFLIVYVSNCEIMIIVISGGMKITKIEKKNNGYIVGEYFTQKQTKHGKTGRTQCVGIAFANYCNMGNEKKKKTSQRSSSLIITPWLKKNLKRWTSVSPVSGSDG